MEQQDVKVALVTDAAGGMGKVCAQELARRGWSIFLHHTASAELGEAAAESVQRAGTDGGQEIRVAAARADLTDSEQREQLVEQALESFGQIDLLVNVPSARPVVAEDLLEMTADGFRAVTESMLTATLFLTQLVANEMVRLVEAGMIENPKIVTINSISAYTTSPDHGAHCIARAGLGMMTRLLADRLGEHGVNVYEIRTGLVSGGAGDPAHSRYDSLISEGLTPLRRWGRPGDVARAVAAVAEGLLGFSTGQVLDVDGGFHLRRL